MVGQSVARREAPGTVDVQRPPLLEGFDDLRPQDLKIPVIKIVQGVSRMEGAQKHGGELYNSITAEFAATLDVVFLYGKHGRSLFEKDSGSDKPECRSNDAITGNVYGACSQCQFNPEVHEELWGNSDLKRCSRGFDFLLAVIDGGVAAISVRKTNLAAAKQLLSQLTYRKLPLFGAVVTLSTVLRSEPGKQWSALVLKVKRVLADDEMQQYREMAAAIKATRYEVVDDESEAGNGHDAQPGDDAPPPSDTDAPF